MMLTGPVLVSLLTAASVCAEGDPAKGKELYLRSCSQCHGEAGDGKGPAAERLLPKPRDFTTGAFKIRSTPNGELPTDEDLVRAISEGLPGTSMPAWKDAFGQKDIRNLADYIKTFSDRFKTERPSKVYSLQGTKKADGESLANGRKLYLEMQCHSCHGMEGRADGPSAPTLTDDSGVPIRPANLHKGWNLRGGHKVSDIFRTFMTGLNGTPMPSYVDALGETPEGLAKAWDLANYVHSLSPDQPLTSEVVRSRWLDGELPASPDHPAWERAPSSGFLMLGQIMEDPRQFTPSIDYVSVRSLYNRDEVALLVEWDDPRPDPNEDQQGRPDAFQIQTPLALLPDSREGEKPYFLEGDPAHPVHLWRWDSKTRGISSLKATGLSSAKAQMVALHVSSAAYADGRWRLAVKRPRKVPKEQGLSLEPGVFVPTAFSAWDGSNGDEGSKRSVSSWYYLLLEPKRHKALYAAPALAFFLVGGLEFWFFKRRRRTRGGPDV